MTNVRFLDKQHATCEQQDMWHSDTQTIDSHTGHDTGHESVIWIWVLIITLGGATINLTWSHYRFKAATAVLTYAAVLQWAAQQSGQNWMLIRSKDSLLWLLARLKRLFFPSVGQQKEDGASSQLIIVNWWLMEGSSFVILWFVLNYWKIIKISFDRRIEYLANVRMSTDLKTKKHSESVYNIYQLEKLEAAKAAWLVHSMS